MTCTTVRKEGSKDPENLRKVTVGRPKKSKKGNGHICIKNNSKKNHIYWFDEINCKFEMASKGSDCVMLLLCFVAHDYITF